jgi:hypothetical protein
MEGPLCLSDRDHLGDVYRFDLIINHEYRKLETFC